MWIILILSLKNMRRFPPLSIRRKDKGSASKIDIISLPPLWGIAGYHLLKHLL